MNQKIQTISDAIKALLNRDMRNTCQHENTHRGGVLWEICDDCGAKWADDRGGKPKWQDPPEWQNAEIAIDLLKGLVESFREELDKLSIRNYELRMENARKAERKVMKTLRELLEEASSSIEIYKHPDLDDMRPALNAVLKAADLGSTGNDQITYIYEHKGIGGFFEIRTEWSTRNCAQTSEYRLPTSIVDAEDPLQAAFDWQYSKALNKAEVEFKRCTDALDRARSNLESLKQREIRNVNNNI